MYNLFSFKYESAVISDANSQLLMPNNRSYDYAPLYENLLGKGRTPDLFSANAKRYKN